MKITRSLMHKNRVNRKNSVQTAHYFFYLPEDTSQKEPTWILFQIQKSKELWMRSATEPERFSDETLFSI